MKQNVTMYLQMENAMVFFLFIKLSKIVINKSATMFIQECGIVFTQPNVKIVGGEEALPHSWPSSAYIVFSYESHVKVLDEVVHIERHFICSGTLINRNTVLTAAHCIVKEIEFTYESAHYSLTVTPNMFYPTFESMISVYLGVHYSEFIISNGVTAPAVKADVSKIIRVKKVLI